MNKQSTAEMHSNLTDPPLDQNPGTFWQLTTKRLLGHVDYGVHLRNVGPTHVLQSCHVGAFKFFRPGVRYLFWSSIIRIHVRRRKVSLKRVKLYPNYPIIDDFKIWFIFMIESDDSITTSYDNNHDFMWKWWSFIFILCYNLYHMFSVIIFFLHQSKSIETKRRYYREIWLYFLFDIQYLLQSSINLDSLRMFLF